MHLTRQLADVTAYYWCAGFAVYDLSQRILHSIIRASQDQQEANHCASTSASGRTMACLRPEVDRSEGGMRFATGCMPPKAVEPVCPARFRAKTEGRRRDSIRQRLPFDAQTGASALALIQGNRLTERKRVGQITETCVSPAAVATRGWQRWLPTNSLGS